MTTETKVEAVAPYVETAPERIYLQVADDEYYAQDPFPTGEEITWCSDSVMALEVPYVRADLHQSAITALEGEVAYYKENFQSCMATLNAINSAIIEADEDGRGFVPVHQLQAALTKETP